VVEENPFSGKSPRKRNRRERTIRVELEHRFIETPFLFGKFSNTVSNSPYALYRKISLLSNPLPPLCQDLF
jgi:hypothetical protein